MTKTENINKNIENLKKVMSAIFNIDIADINDDSSMDNIEEWDSLRHMNLIIAIEQEFGISLPDEEVGSFTSFALLNLCINETLMRKS